MSLMRKEIYEFGPFSSDPAERVIFRDGTPLSRTRKVFDTLVCLVRNRGRLLICGSTRIWQGTGRKCANFDWRNRESLCRIFLPR